MLAALDIALLRALRSRGHPPAVERAVVRFSRLGEHGSLWLALAATGALVDGSRRESWARAGAAVAGAYVANQATKLIVRRRRPELPGLPAVVSTHSRLSYPSAHSTTSFAGARSMSALVPGAPLYALATAMALSRPYLGVHYPSDSLAGVALGLAVAELAR